MACNRLWSIWRIGMYTNGKLPIKRPNTKHRHRPFHVFAQLVGAFLVSIAFHLPFFLDDSKTGPCEYYSVEGKSKYI